MPTIEQINDIHRLHWRLKLSLRVIARKLQLNRRTVAKYLRDPAPQPSTRHVPSKLDPHRQAIGELLAESPHASAVVLLQHLRPLGFDGGITILKDYLR